MFSRNNALVTCVAIAFLALVSSWACTGPTGGGNNNDNNNNGGDPVTADAGVDQTVGGGDVVTLDGSGSVSATGDALAFVWTQTGGTTVSLSGANTVMASFTAPNVDESLTFDLTATDGANNSDTDSVTVNVTSQPTVLFVVNNNSSVTSYTNANALNGEIEPTTKINLGAATSLFQPRSIIITTSGRLLLSRQNGGIVGYDNGANATDDTPADIVVDGTDTLLDAPISFAYDPTNDRLFVGDTSAGDGILVFDNVSDASFNGEVMPDRTFGPPDRVPFNSVSTSLSMVIDAMEFDPDGNLYVSDSSGLNVNSSRVLVFADPGSASGQATPIRTLESTWGGIEDLAVDKNGVLYVVDSSESVFIFHNPETLDGDVTPNATVTVMVSLVDLQGVVVGADGTGYLADTSNDAIYSFDVLSTRSGTLVPDRTLEGFDTSLRTPRQMFLLEQ